MQWIRGGRAGRDSKINIFLRLYSTILFFFFFLYIKYSRYQINDHNFIEKRNSNSFFEFLERGGTNIYIYMCVQRFDRLDLWINEGSWLSVSEDSPVFVVSKGGRL